MSEQGELGPLLAGEQDRIVAVVGVDDFETRLGQAVAQRGQHQPVIVHDQDLAFAHCTPPCVTALSPRGPAHGV